MSANDRQVGGNHYKGDLQHWDFVLALNLPYLEAQVVRYVTRHKKKGGAEDLEKAIHFLQKLEDQRAKALEYWLDVYQQANNLEEREYDTIELLILGRYGESMAQIQSILVTEYGEADKSYTNQGD